MNIVIDCRYLGMSGIGRVLEGILDNLPPDHNYYYLGKKESILKYINTNNIIEDFTNPFSFKGLFINKQINDYDLFFTPNFIVPFNIKIKTYVIIHDLIFLDVKASCNGFIDYRIKKFLLKRATKKANKIFTVSKFTKSRINYHFPRTKKEIIVAYNGLSKSIKNYKALNINVKKKDKQLIYVGNIKKHKGLATLASAMEKLPEYTLYIVGNKDGFRTSDNKLNEYLNNKNIIFTGKLSDNALYTLISESTFLIQPSLYEGFGLPPLEALYLGTKPIISDIPVFKELYNNLDVVFFKVEDSYELSNKIKTSNSICQFDIKQIDEYSYKNFAIKIFKD